MKLDRWMILTALACVAFATAYLPPDPRARYENESINAPERRAALINAMYDKTERLLGDLRLRDSLRATLRAVPSVAGVAVQIHGDIPPTSQQVFRGAVEQVWRNSRPDPSARLLVVLDAAKRRPENPTYILPAALDGRTCAVTLTLEWELGWLRAPVRTDQNTNLQPSLLESLGPCLYYSAFGEPGPRIQAWLEERSFVIATVADWETAPHTVLVRGDPQAFDMIVSDMTFDGLACTSGAVSRCQQAVETSTYEGATRIRASRQEIPGVFHEAYWPRSFPFDYHYLSALVREMGHDRFGRFWRSNAPVKTAFATAFGQPIDEWTAHWARTYLPDFPPLHTAPRSSAVFFGLGLGIIAVALSLVYVARRQVS